MAKQERHFNIPGKKYLLKARRQNYACGPGCAEKKASSYITGYNTRMRVRCALMFLFVFFLGAPAYAQSSFVSSGNSISIIMEPRLPAPGDSVRLSAASSQTDLERSDVTWYANNEVIAQGPGVKEVALVAGPLGSETGVFVAAISADGTSDSGEIFIRPSEIDLLWESDSYVPPFYRGRALPSAGTMMRVQALARLQTPGGALIPERDIIYTWRRNGVIQRSVSGRGKSAADLPSPALFGADIIQVDAAFLDGLFEGETIVRVPSIEPVLVLYKVHPLFGTMYHQALGGQAFIPDSEMTFTAVPYFAQAQSPSDPRLIYAWQVNGKDVLASGAGPDEITINAGKSSGLARIELSLTHAANWLMQSIGTWSISFSAGGGSFGAEPFQAAQ